MGWKTRGFPVAMVLLACGGVARAEGVDDATLGAARLLGSSGVAAYQANDFKGANEKLGRAYQVLQVPSLGLWSARALVKVGKLVEAGQRYLDVTRLSISTGEAAVQKKAQADAQTELAALTPRIPSIVIKVEGAEASAVEVSIDGAPISSALVGENRPVNPGVHRVSGVRGDAHVEISVTLAESEQQVALLKFVSARPEAAPHAPGSSPPVVAASTATESDLQPGTSSVRPTVAWALVGVGAAGLSVGAITGILVLNKKSSIDGNSECYDNQCLASQRDLVSSYNSLRTVSTVSLVAGGVLAGTGVALLLTAPKANETAHAPSQLRARPTFAVSLGLGTATLAGRF